MRKLSNNAIAVLMILFIVVMSANFVYLNLSAKPVVITGRGVGIGQASICINHPPVLAEDCPRNVSVYSLYRCDTNATDGDNDTLTYRDYTNMFEIGNITGEILFVPNDSAIGNTTFNISANDNLGCSNSYVNKSISLYVYSVCGEGICSSDESYSSCQADCDEGAPGGGGGSAGSGASGAPRGGFSTVSTPSFVMKPEYIIKSLAPGQNAEETFVISNNGTRKTAVIFSIEGVKDLITLSVPGVTLERKAKENVKVKFNISTDQKLGAYTGKIIGDSSGVKQSIAIILEVESSLKRFDLSLFIPKEYLTVDAGDDLKAQVTIFDTSDAGASEVNVRYVVKDLNNNKILAESETIDVEDQSSYQKTLEIPDTAASGTHVLAVELTHGNQLSIATREFTIIGTSPGGQFLAAQFGGETSTSLWIVTALALVIGLGAVYWLMRDKVI